MSVSASLPRDISFKFQYSISFALSSKYIHDVMDNNRAGSAINKTRPRLARFSSYINNLPDTPSLSQHRKKRNYHLPIMIELLPVFCLPATGVGLLRV